ncbi:MAG: hypothetical protein JXQ85_15835 [Cognatishimia sp.]
MRGRIADPGRWLNDNFAGWQNLTPHEKKAIRDFPVLWSLFELRATGQFGQRPNATPMRICNAVEELQADLDLEALQRTRNYFSDRYFQEGNPTNAFHQLRVPNDFQGRVRTALLEGNADARAILLGLLLIVNRLRNNFLHGEKAAYAFADQLANFRHANNVLMYAVPLWGEF